MKPATISKYLKEADIKKQERDFFRKVIPELKIRVIPSCHPKFIGHNEDMTEKVSVSQVPNSPEGEKQGWPVKVVRAGVGGSGFWRVFMDVCRE